MPINMEAPMASTSILSFSAQGVRAQGWGMYIFENVYLYWIYAANNLGSMCRVLDISCQHLGDECKLEDFCWISCK